MIFDRQQQRLLLEGKEYAPEDIFRLVAEGAGNCPPALWDLYLFLNEWFDASPVITVHTSGSTGVPKELVVRKDRMMQSARLTCEFLNLQAGDTALLCMNLRYIGAMMMVVRSLVAGLNLVVRPASGHPLSDVEVPLKFAAMVPLQVYNTLRVPAERKRLEHTDILIIGGGAVDDSLEAELKTIPIAAYSTYGMTETLSHIALRRLNGEAASKCYYPFPSVELSLSAENTLIVKAPLICDDVLQTNDIACLCSDGGFTIAGRKDNVINSGGIKIQAEEMENRLQPFIPVPFAVTAVPDQRVPVIRLRLCQSQTILGILNHHQRITFTHTLVLFEIYLLDKSLYTGIYRGNMLFHLGIIRVFHPSQMNKTTGYPTNTDNNNKD